jgi:hypothetical protein
MPGGIAWLATELFWAVVFEGEFSTWTGVVVAKETWSWIELATSPDFSVKVPSEQATAARIKMPKNKKIARFGFTFI